jgi:flagellar biosynthesis component FlhA
VVEESIPAMRARILEETGVRIPGVRIRPNGSLASRTFKVRLWGVPYRGGSVPVDGRLCPDGAACQARDLEGPPLANAWLGVNAGTWLSPDDVEAVAGALPLLTPYEAMLWCVEGLVRVHLWRLIGVDEVEALLDEWRSEDELRRADHIKRVLPHAGDHTRFTAVVRTLVREQVPVRNLGLLLDALERGQGLRPTVEAARAGLRNDLPGNRDIRTLVGLGEKSEAALRTADGVSLASAHATTLLSEARHAFDHLGAGQYALVVDDPAIRPAVQELAETVVPTVAVVSSDELNETARNKLDEVVRA